MALKSGFDSFSGSMAAAMQEAFMAAWPEYMEGQPLPDTNPQMQLMFVAVARGVVKHLTENESAFQIIVNSNDSHSHSAYIDEIQGG